MATEQEEIRGRLAEYAFQTQYAVVFTGQIPWLTWGDAHFSRDGHFFKRLFPPFRPIHFWQYSSLPQANYILRFINWPVEMKKFRQTYRKLVEEAVGRSRTGNPKDKIDRRKLPSYIAMRDAVVEEVRRRGEQLREPIENIRDILKVITIEAEKSIMVGRFAPELSFNEFESFVGMRMLHQPDEYVNWYITQRFSGPKPGDQLRQILSIRRSLWGLWGKIVEGGSRELIEERIDEVFRDIGLPVFLASAQKYGILFYLEQRDKVLHATVGLELKRRAYEALVLAVVCDEALPRSIIPNVFHERVLKLGKKLRDMREKKEKWPEGMTEFCKWGERVLNVSIQYTLEVMGIWEPGEQGRKSTESSMLMIQRCIDYVERFE